MYVCKQYYKETNKYIGYNKLYHELKNNEHYKSLIASTSQQILRLVDKNYRSFFALLKRKLSGKYNGQVNEPNFRPKGSQFILIFPNNVINIKNGFLKLTKELKIPFTYNIDGKLKQVIITPHKNNYFNISIQYEENKKETKSLNKERILGIDLGINNLASCLSSIGTSLIVNGKPLKSYNQYYNKRKAKIQSELETKNKKQWSNKLNVLSINRSNYINNYMNQTLNLLVKHCLFNDIGKVVCGYNEGWKQEINLGKINNQKFTSIPYHSLKRKLENKCKEYGIEFVMHEESYTSKCSFVDSEKVCRHDVYVGSRVKRGLFRTQKGLLVNADVQASGNLIRKVVPNTKFVDGIEGVIVHPKVFNIFKPLKKFNKF